MRACAAAATLLTLDGLVTMTHAESVCKDANAKTITNPSDADHHDAAHHRTLADDNHDHSSHDHGDLAPWLLREAKCGSWESIISNYSATAGTMGGTYVRVFSDGTATSQVDTTINRDGVVLKETKVMGHLHVGSCFTNDAGNMSPPAYDASGQRPTTVGDHWMNDKKEEVHFMFSTKANGESHSMTCTKYPINRKAMSVVLHEYDTNAVIGIEAKKLCCNLVWDVKDREMPAANGGVSQSAAVAVVSVMVASLLAAVLL